MYSGVHVLILYHPIGRCGDRLSMPDCRYIDRIIELIVYGNASTSTCIEPLDHSLHRSRKLTQYHVAWQLTSRGEHSVDHGVCSRLFLSPMDRLRCPPIHIPTVFSSFSVSFPSFSLLFFSPHSMCVSLLIPSWNLSTYHHHRRNN